MKSLYIMLIGAASSLSAGAAAPSNYYSSCEYKGGQALLQALNAKVGPHDVVSYSGLWELYKSSDVYPDGKIWDMYSTKHWDAGEKCGNYSRIGDCYNREHSFPKSWFNDASPMYSDAYHLYPTDGKVNGQRSNFPYGECANGTTVASSGGVSALGKLGASTFAGYSGTVFEPADEYKGDFARSYFYMAAAYNDKIADWSSPMLAGNSYPCFTTWSVNLLLKWHRQDPVSEKEIDRNEAVYRRQNNRNPFIDHPEMAEYIWGDRKTELWSSSGGAGAELTIPASGSTLDFGTVSTALTANVTVEVGGANLSKDIAVKLTGPFSSTVSTIPYSQAVGGKRYALPVAINARTAGTAAGTLTLTSGTVSSTVNLTATAVEGLPVNGARNITDAGFTASWIYVGDTDAQGNYRLWVTNADGSAVSGYPASVKATDGEYTVTDLAAATPYVYYLTSQSMESTHILFSTAAPVPLIEFYHDGPLYFNAPVGEPSAEAEIDVVTENISGDITLEVKAPFQLSLDHSAWATALTLPEGADRFYVRMLGDTEGEYVSSLKATAGEYVNDEAELRGRIGEAGQFCEDFETPAPGSYGATTYQGTAALWKLSDAGSWEGDPVYEGQRALRLGKNGKGLIEMAEDLTTGLGTVTFYARKWSGDVDAQVEIEYSTDGGQEWLSAGTAAVTATAYQPFECVVNKGGQLRMRLRQTAGKRWLLDNLSGNGYMSTSMQTESAFNSWDAWSQPGSVTVSIAQPATVTVYGADGIVYVQQQLAPGQHTFALPAGLCLVSVDGGVRRVVVR